MSLRLQFKIKFLKILAILFIILQFQKISIQILISNRQSVNNKTFKNNYLKNAKQTLKVKILSVIW